MRVAVGGISNESCTFSPLQATAADFFTLRGDALLARYDFLAGQSAEIVPLTFTRAIPGGRVAAEAYREFKREFLECVKNAGTLDGVYLELHGALYADGLEDAEGDWLEALRALVGPRCLIAASFDLHGNLSECVLKHVDVLSAYRTAPHVDVPETRRRAFELLLRCLREGTRPARAWVALPLALAGELTSTEWEPGLGVYAQIAESLRAAGVLDASIWIGYAWADEPRTGASVVVSGFEKETIEREALRLGRILWDAREHFDFGVETGSIDECIDQALAAPEKSVFVSDSGDNPTAGGAGDVPLFLKRLVERNVERALVAGLADAAAVEACRRAGAGAEVRLSLGGKLDPFTCAPLDVRARVLQLGPEDDAQALIEVIDNGVKAILSARRRPYHTVADMRAMGAEPLAHKLVVIKIGYLEPDLKRHAPRALLALSPGTVDQAIARLPFKRIRRPMFPLDREFPEDPVRVRYFEPNA